MVDNTSGCFNLSFQSWGKPISTCEVGGCTMVTKRFPLLFPPKHPLWTSVEPQSRADEAYSMVGRTCCKYTVNQSEPGISRLSWHRRWSFVVKAPHEALTRASHFKFSCTLMPDRLTRSVRLIAESPMRGARHICRESSKTRNRDSTFPWIRVRVAFGRRLTKAAKLLLHRTSLFNVTATRAHVRGTSIAR